MDAPPPERPIRLVVREGGLERRRLTVFLRLLLAIPHFVWVVLWGIATVVAVVVLWFAVLVSGRAPDGLHDFVATYLRYVTHVYAYLHLAADPHPGFLGRPGYAIDVEIDPPARQSRWSALFRLFLALPVLALAAALGSGLSASSSSSGTSPGDDTSVWWTASAAGVALTAAFLAWFAALALGRVPRGLRDVVAYALGYQVQAYGYLALLTDRYPTSDPALAEQYAHLPEHPIRLQVSEDLERSRLTVVFRLLLAIPHFVWLALWAIAVVFVALAAWVSALVTGRVPASLHGFLAAFVRYATHVGAFVYLVGRRFPGFTGRAGSYGIDVEIDAPERQSRWKTLFRLFLTLPALLLTSAFGGVLVVVAVLGWFYALATARMPDGLRDLGAVCLRYSAQTSGYLLLLTEGYPYAAPVLRPRAAPEPPAAATAPPVGDAF